MNREKLGLGNSIIRDIDNINYVLENNNFRTNLEDLMDIITDYEDIHTAVINLVTEMLKSKLVKLQKEFDEL